MRLRRFGWLFVTLLWLLNCALDAQVESEPHVFLMKRPKDLVKRQTHKAPPGNGISYNGGHVMLYPHNVYIIWYGDWSFNTAESIIPSMFQSIPGSPYLNIATTYYQSGPQYIGNTLNLAGQVYDTYSFGSALSQNDIESIVSEWIAPGELPIDPNGLYFVLTSPDVTESGSEGTFCAQVNGICGFHSHGTIDSFDLDYSFVGDSQTQCLNQQLNCGGQGGPHPDNPAADGMTVVISHEMMETLTDPGLTAWYNSPPYTEVGDLCEDRNLYPDVTLSFGGSSFLVQPIWVNANGGFCGTASPGFWTKADLTSLSGGPTTVGDPMALYSSSLNQQFVDYRAADNHVHQLVASTGTWSHNDLTSITGATPTAGNPWQYMQTSTQVVLYRGTDSDIHSIWKASSWTTSDLTTLAGAPKASGDPTGLYLSNLNSQVVVYVATDGHLHQLYTASGAWSQADLTSLTGAQLPGGRPMEYLAGTAQAVVYRGTDNHIHQLYTASGAWHQADLTSLTGAPTASGDPSGVYNTNTSQQLVVFLGSDNHVHQLWSNSGTWNHSDLTQLTSAAGSPQSSGNPFQYLVGTEQVVAYPGASHVQQLYEYPNSSWTNTDMNGLVSGAVNITGNPFGYARLTQNIIVYRDSNGHVQSVYTTQ